MTYTTLCKKARIEYEIKKSLFIGYAAPVKSEEEAQLFIKEIKLRHSDATHNVFGYYISGGIMARYSDDGEPQGTAGMPVLDVIRKSGANDTCVVVTRYYGGTQLGAGGLVRAYAHTATLAIEEAEIVTYNQYSELEFSAPYSDYDRYLNEFSKFNVIVDDTKFEEKVSVRIAVIHSEKDILLDRISQISQGRITPRETGKRFDSKK